jgi:phage portal protein, lambda family
MAVMTGLRRRIGAMIGGFGFDAGAYGRRLMKFRPSRAHVNTLIGQAGPTITARARWLVRNNGYALNALESWTGNAVGDGVKPTSKVEDAEKKQAIQALWEEWQAEADSEGLTDFYGLQRRAARELFLTGEVFFRFRPRRPEDGLSVPLQLQMLPSEMLPINMTKELPGGGMIRQGIEFDLLGRRAAYYFYRRHPGDSTDPRLAGEIVRVPASEVLHIIDPVEAGQVRGVSRFAPAIVKLFFLDQYDDAELDRKKVSSMFALFVTSPQVDAPLDSPDEPLAVEPGQVVRLDPGEEIATPSPPDSGPTYEPFQYRTLLQVSAALGVPYSYVSNDLAKANFANSRLSIIEFRRRVIAWQHRVLIHQLCKPVWARWMDTAVMAGALDLPDYAATRRTWLKCEWLPPKWEWVDPLKDISAEIAEIEAGLKSRSMAMKQRGYDADRVDEEIATDRMREADLGLDFRRPGSPAQGAAQLVDAPGDMPSNTTETANP